MGDANVYSQSEKQQTEFVSGLKMGMGVSSMICMLLVRDQVSLIEVLHNIITVTLRLVHRFDILY